MAKKTPPKPNPTPTALSRGDVLTDEDAEFIAHYLSGPTRFNAVAAAIGAGRTRENAIQNAWRWRRKPCVAAALDHWRRARIREGIDSLDRYREELRALAFARVSDVADWSDGSVTLVDPDLVEPAALAAISEVRAGPRGLAVKMHSKTESLKQYGQLMGYVGSDGANDSDEERRRQLSELRELIVSGEPDQTEPE
jgi:phage terminase small subunit